MFDLKGFRKEFQLKQSDVAELFNIGQSSISEIDNLKRDLTEEQKAIIKKKYGLDMFEKYNIEETSLEIVYDNPKGVPYFENIEATGSILSLYNDYPEVPTFYINYPHFDDCTAYVPMVGDSMFPMYSSGEIIAVKKVDNTDILLWGEAYLVVTNGNANSLRTVKLVHQHEDDSKIILRASNPNYRGDTVLNKADVISMFIVKGRIRRNQL